MGAVTAGADTSGTFQVNGTLATKFAPVDCPGGTPATTACHAAHTVWPTSFRGLGEATVVYTLVLDDFGSACMHLHAAQIPIVIAGKGEIDLAAASTGCITPEQLGSTGFSLPYTVSGGSGQYAGASGSGTLGYRNHDFTGPESGSADITWAGTLNVPGATFDTTPPRIAGATSKTVKTRRASGKRVRYSVTATDAIDGPVTVTCSPKSGSRFHVGRTRVSCASVDSSDNRAKAHFVIRVKRVG